MSNRINYRRNSDRQSVSWDGKASRLAACKHRASASMVIRTYKAGMSDGVPFYIQVCKCRDCGTQYSKRVD